MVELEYSNILYSGAEHRKTETELCIYMQIPSYALASSFFPANLIVSSSIRVTMTTKSRDHAPAVDDGGGRS